MRSNGRDDERFLAELTSDEGVSDEETTRLDSEPPPAPARPSRAPRKPRAKKSVAPKAAATAEPSEVAPKTSRRPPAKRAKPDGDAPKSRRAPSTAPKSRRMPAAAARDSSLTPPPPPSSHAPLSMDPRTTLRDHPGQQSAAHAVRAAVASMRPPPPAPVQDDQISIPPTSSDPPDGVDEKFFADGEAVHRAHVAEAKKASLRPKHLQLEEEHELRVPVVVPVERKRRMANYVKIAVGVSAFLCLVAGAREGLRHFAPSHVEEAAVVAHAPPQVAPAAQPVAAAAPPPAAEVPAAAPPASPADEPAAAPPAKSAKEEKEDARRALERGKRKDAIDAAQRSVDLDPTDAEAWLLLGSAQQDSGHWKEGREAYVQCTKVAKSGPVSECRMMLR